MTGFLAELRRRNVFRVAAAYLVVGWIVMQIVATIGGAAGLPDWADSFALIILVAGFPVVLFIAWAFELTPDGVKKTGAADPAEGFRPLGASDYLLTAGVIVVVGVAGIQAFIPDRNPELPGSARIQTDGQAARVAISANSIAVLPFADLSEAGDQEYFGDGIAEEILNVLARIEALDVTSRTSAFAFKSQSALSIRDIAASLQVRHVLEGSVRTSGDMIRITAQLIDAETDQHLWSETFDRQRNAENIFAIQDEISAAIIAELTRELGLEIQPPSAIATGGTTELSAYEAFLQGRTLFVNRNYENLPLAVERLEYAVSVDPAFERAWAVLASAYSVSPGWGFSDRDYLALTADAAARALAINPDSSMAFTALANSFQQTVPPHWEDAYENFARAIERDPNNSTAHLWQGQLWRSLGYLDRYEESARRCLEVEPNYGVCIYDYAAAALAQGRVEEAFERLHPLLATSHAESYPAFLGMAAGTGRELILRMMLRETADFLGDDTRWIVADLSRALSDEDYDREAALTRFEARLRDQGFEREDDHYIAMTYLLAFGDYGSVPTRLTTSWWWFNGYDDLRGSEAARNGIIELGIDDYWRVYGFPDQCRPVGSDDFECWFEDRS